MFTGTSIRARLNEAWRLGFSTRQPVAGSLCCRSPASVIPIGCASRDRRGVPAHATMGARRGPCAHCGGQAATMLASVNVAFSPSSPRSSGRGWGSANGERGRCGPLRSAPGGSAPKSPTNAEVFGDRARSPQDSRASQRSLTTCADPRKVDGRVGEPGVSDRPRSMGNSRIASTSSWAGVSPCSQTRSP